MASFRIVYQLLLGAIIFNTGYSETKTEYMSRRQEFLSAERHQGLGGDIKFTAKEAVVNTKLMQLKQEELKKYRDDGNGEHFPPVINFMKSRANIDGSELFQIIKEMPKGAALHVHDQAITDLRWTIANLTYREDCWACFMKNGDLKMGFFDKLPIDPNCKWFSVVAARRSFGNDKQFDEIIYQKMSMDDGQVLSNQNAIWRKFLSCFSAIEGLFMSEIGFDPIFTRGLQDFYDDNVQYMEIRGLFSQVARSDGTFFEPDWLIKAYADSAEKFSKKNPDFVGMKNIVTVIRAFGADDIRSGLQTALRWKKAYPGQIAGFDLVAQEDPGHPLVYFIDELLEPSSGTDETDLPYIFHAGETNWVGQDVDENLVDAVLLNTTRIGHGYALSSHPKVMKHVMKHNIAIEVNPISNQVLGLVSDLRNHPAATYMALGLPVVISSDDPVLWGASPMSHDFYEAFMAFTGGWGDLGTLKRLAMNSIMYSSMSAEEKQKTTEIWQRKWEEFLDHVIQKYQL